MGPLDMNNWIIILVLLLTLSIPAITGAKEFTDDEKIKLSMKMATKIISSNHYRQHQLDDKISSQIFDDFFKFLDPGKLYITNADVKSLESYRYRLDDDLNNGNPEFPLKVYNIYLERLGLYRQYAEGLLAKGFDFTADENMLIDRSKQPRAEDVDGLYEIWRKKIKNDLLYFKLLKRAMAEDSLKPAAKNSKSGKKGNNDVDWDSKTPEDKIKIRLRDIYNEASQKDKIDIVGFFLTCMALTYGPHSSYFSPRIEEDFDIDMKLSLSGIGAVLSSEDGYTKVVSIVPGGPAFKEGRLSENDKIIAVTQEKSPAVDVIDMSLNKVVKMIRGPQNSKVTLTVISGKKGSSSIPYNITITRDKVELKDSEAYGFIKEIKRADGSVAKFGIISLSHFYMDFQAASNGDPNYKSSTRDVKNILEKFNRAGIDGLIFDLRSNGGGSLQEAISLSGLFIEEGPIVQVRSSNRSVKINNDLDPQIHYSGPMIVLTNRLTSSAAEIFAGAMKDYRRAIIVGDSRTYGKGTVLDVIKLDRWLSYINLKFPAGSVKFESAVFYRVNGSSTQQLGIAPDIQFPSITDNMKVGEMFSDNHLPWDAIPPVAHITWDNNIEKLLHELKKNSEARIKLDPSYKALKDSIELFNKYKDRQYVSLNESKRWAEYIDEKKSFDDQEKVLARDERLESRKGKDDKKDETDFLIDESINILADYNRLIKKNTLAVK
jgi:carboxyl-terminal processing protease